MSSTKKGRIAYVTLNRSEVMNALHPPTHKDLWEVWCDFQDDPEMRVAIVSDAGDRAFSTGNDLKYAATHAAERGTHPLPPGGFGGITNRFECYKPIIATANGYALEGEFKITLACDIIIAAEHARFGLPEPTVSLLAGASNLLQVFVAYGTGNKHINRFRRSVPPHLLCNNSRV